MRIVGSAKVANGRVTMKENLEKQEKGRWATINGRRVLVAPRAPVTGYKTREEASAVLPGEPESQERTLALLRRDLLGATVGTSAYGALKHAIYMAEQGKDAEGDPIEGWENLTEQED